MTVESEPQAEKKRKAGASRLRRSLSALTGGANAETAPEAAPETLDDATTAPAEIGGPDGPDPTRYGDWERKGRCIDF